MQLAIGRGPFICQSQSLNLYLANPVHQKMSAMHFYGWRSGLKTGQYYFRSRPARDAIKFTVNVESLLQAAEKGNSTQVMECLNVDNAKQNLIRKKARTTTEKPADELKQQLKRPVMATPAAKETTIQVAGNEKEAEDSDSYEFNPVCENCAG
jgi:ribonucleotide reductase alpha subunit